MGFMGNFNDTAALAIRVALRTCVSGRRCAIADITGVYLQASCGKLEVSEDLFAIRSTYVRICCSPMKIGFRS